MNKNLTIFLITFSFLFFSCNIIGCSNGSSQATKISPKTYNLPVIKVVKKKIPISYITPGSVISDISIKITSRITGFIKRVTVREGQHVKKGQLLVTLDDADVEGAINQTQAAVAKATAAHVDAVTDAKRFETLFLKKSASDNTLRKYRLQSNIAKDNLTAAKAALQTALAQRNYISIVSPVDGIVIARHKLKGDLATPGAPILSVESSKALLFETFVAEARVQNIYSGDKIKVKIDAVNDFFEGVVTRIVPSGDPVTHRYQVKIALDNNTGLLPGMFGRANFIIGYEQIIAIPIGSFISRYGIEGVFVIDKQNITRFRWVQTARIWPDHIEIKAGIRKGERIVADAKHYLKDGDIIKAKASDNE